MIRTLRHLRPIWHYHKRCAALSSKASHVDTQFPPQHDPPKTSSSASQHLAGLLDRHHDAILFSSYQQAMTLNWTEQQIASRFERKLKESAARENVRIKPFSLAAQLLSNEPNDDSEKRNDPIAEEAEKRTGGTDRMGHLEDQRVNSGEWMRDYESYGESDDDGHLGVYGTPDPSQPVSKAPCYGCGSLMQCAEPSLPGYLPSELFVGHPDSFLKTITCQRCHFLKNYNTVIDVTVPPEEYVRLISSIGDQFALAILMVDLTDFPCSIWPQIHEIIGRKRPVFVVGNKVDLLPRDSPGYLRHVRQCLETAVELSGIPGANIKHTCLISAETGFGVEELITKLHNVWLYKGDVYLLGCTNVGKSTLFNALLRSDYCKTKAASIIGKATASPWPGTTMRMLKFPILRPNDWRVYVRTKRLVSVRSIKAAEEQLRRDQAMTTRHVKHATLIGHIGNTFLEKPADETNDAFLMGKAAAPVLQINEKDKEYATSKWCFDTPGVIQPEQTLNLLTTEELLLAIPKRMIRPRAFKLHAGMSLLLAGMGRLDVVRVPDEGQAIRVIVFASDKLPVVIVRTDAAERVYREALGTELLAVPVGDAERLARWPALEGKAMRVLGVVGERVAACDLLMSSAGWIGINVPDGKVVHFKVWTPEGRGIVKRTPSLVPNALSLCGKRLRGSLAYTNSHSFV